MKLGEEIIIITSTFDSYRVARPWFVNTIVIIYYDYLSWLSEQYIQI